MRHHPTLFAALVLGAALLASPALAKKPDHADRYEPYRTEYSGRDKGHYDKRQYNDRDVRITVRFDDDRRGRAQHYMRNHFRSYCPPGLAKKRHRCMPPGIAKRYYVGGMLPRVYEALPHDLYSVMGPPPSGAFYAMVDKDVLLVSEATKKILDAVTLLSAMD